MAATMKILHYLFSFLFLATLGLGAPAWVEHVRRNGMSVSPRQAFTPPYDPSPFADIGYITDLADFTLNQQVRSTGTDAIFRGGTVRVNGKRIVIPDNTLITLPSITVAWSEIFKADGTPNLPQLGKVGWEVTVLGNRVNGQEIAGLIYLTQETAYTTQGFISTIDPSTGIFTLDTMPGKNLVLNDPLGRFAKKYTDNPLWTIDPDNPSIKASTGYPLCIPQSANDPGCPAKNRPSANPNAFTMPKAPTDNTATTSGPDSRLPAPLIVGDYVTFSAVNIDGNTFAVYALTANLGIQTAAGDLPAYITVESVNWGVVDPNAGAVETAETRAVVFTTDASGPTIQWSTLDVDPCTDAVTERSIQVGTPSQAAPVGRIQFRNGKVSFNTPPRQVVMRVSNTGAPRVLANTLRAGEFTQPLFDYIFPEPLTFGANMPPNNFDVFDFLTQGAGHYQSGVPGTTLSPQPKIGQLDPWPGKTAPAVKQCTTTTAPPTTTPSSPPAAATPPVDTISNIVVTSTKQKGGQISITVTAQTDAKIASGEKFSLSMATNNPNTGPTVMTQTSPGSNTWTITQLMKPNKLPQSVTITSTRGAKLTK